MYTRLRERPVFSLSIPTASLDKPDTKAWAVGFDIFSISSTSFAVTTGLPNNFFNNSLANF